MSLVSHSRLFLFLIATSLIVCALESRASAQGEIRALEVGAPVEREIAGGESHDYQVSLRAGQFLRLSWGQQKFGLVLTVYGPDGKPLLVVNHEPHAKPSIDVAVVADASGAYRINVSNASRGATPLRYQLAAVELRAAGERDRELFAAEAAEAEAERLNSQNTAQGRLAAVAKYEEASALWRDAGVHEA